MKKVVFFLVLSFFGNCCFSQIQCLLLNKSSIITDTIHFKMINQTKERIHFNFSIEVFANGHWIELYDNIYQFDRNKVQSFETLPRQNQIFQYDIYKIASDYRNIYNGKSFRLTINTFPANPFDNLKKIRSKTFKLKWVNIERHDEFQN
jgi:hypothetical protein